MKKLAVIFLFISSLCLASAVAEVDHSRKGSGLIRIKHSPTLGTNVTISIGIDGLPAGHFSRGHVFERPIAPGRHTLTASRTGNRSSPWHGSLDVQAGHTYSFVVKANPDQVYLVPVSRID